MGKEPAADDDNDCNNRNDDDLYRSIRWNIHPLFGVSSAPSLVPSSYVSLQSFRRPSRREGEKKEGDEEREGGRTEKGLALVFEESEERKCIHTFALAVVVVTCSVVCITCIRSLFCCMHSLSSPLPAFPWEKAKGKSREGCREGVHKEKDRKRRERENTTKHREGEIDNKT